MSFIIVALYVISSALSSMQQSSEKNRVLEWIRALQLSQEASVCQFLCLFDHHEYRVLSSVQRWNPGPTWS
jgi:hypothetical protein